MRSPTPPRAPLGRGRREEGTRTRAGFVGWKLGWGGSQAERSAPVNFAGCGRVCGLGRRSRSVALFGWHGRAAWGCYTTTLLASGAVHSEDGLAGPCGLPSPWRDLEGKWVQGTPRSALEPVRVAPCRPQGLAGKNCPSLVRAFSRLGRSPVDRRGPREASLTTTGSLFAVPAADRSPVRRPGSCGFGLACLGVPGVGIVLERGRRGPGGAVVSAASGLQGRCAPSTGDQQARPEGTPVSVRVRVRLLSLSRHWQWHFLCTGLGNSPPQP